MKKKRIYIAGKISGEDRESCIAKFENAQKEIEAQGFIALNPIKMVGNWDVTWEQAMRICIIILMSADAVFFLPDWMLSAGAQIEHKLSYDIGIKILTGSSRDLINRV